MQQVKNRNILFGDGIFSPLLNSWCLVGYRLPLNKGREGRSNTMDNNNLSKIINFLELIHPFLKEDNYKNECIEIRAIPRTQNLKVRSSNFWRLSDEKSQSYLKKFYLETITKPYCLYYSVFSLDYTKRIYKPDGTEYEKGHINIQNAVFTQILIADFDNIDEENYIKYYNQFIDLGIEPLSVFSGHGYQLIILLKEKCYDKGILKLFNKVLLDKGFPIDSNIVDSARIMRLPYTYNNKEFADSEKNNHRSIPTYILHYTEKRYDINEIFDALDKTNKTTTAPNFTVNSEGVAESIDVSIVPEGYDETLFNMFPETVKKMLIMTPEHCRNSAMFFLIPYFRNTHNLSVEQIKEIMSVWATRCNPPLDVYFVRSEVERILNYEFDGKCGKYGEELRRVFGELHLGMVLKN